MTREEALEILESQKNEHYKEELNEALDMAISALSENKGECFDGMTNGEVIQALFPKAKIFENESNIEYSYVDVFLYSENDMNCYKKDWWNAPYKAEKGGE